MLENQKPPIPVLIEDLGMQYPTEKSKRKYRFGVYQCQCGKEFIASTSDVKRYNVNSCGCYQKKIARCNQTTHGLSNHQLYQPWLDMRNRCCNIKYKHYADYGGRGIKVCDRWMDIHNFIEDMYPTYQDGLSIDRINNDGNYEPSNCRWATQFVQSRNTRVIRSTNTSGYRGVYFHKANNNWVSKIMVNLKSRQLGSFETALEAAKAYDTYAIENNLEHTINGVI